MLHRYKCRYPKLLFGVFFIALACPFADAVDGHFPAQAVSKDGLKRTLHYSMNGRIRLLLFWIGRDRVGGGAVTLESIPIQIQDNPRWWLQVRLQLAGMEDIEKCD